MRVSALIIGMVISGNLFASEYQNGWNYKNFYETVNECRTAVVFPAGSDYEKKGIENKTSEEDLRGELIQVTPVLDTISTKSCFCAINEAAKDIAYLEKQKGIDYESYMNIPRCVRAMKEVMANLKPDIEKLK